MKHLSLRRVRTPRHLLAAAAFCLVLPAGASADVPITAFKAGPVASYNHPTGLPITSAPSFDTGCLYGTPGAPINTSNPDIPLALATQAGASTDFCVAFRVAPGDAIAGTDMNNSLVQLPVGSLAEIDNASKCTLEEFNRESTSPTTCPSSSQVGTALAQLEVATGPATRITQDAPGRIYALSTPSDKAALLGVALIGSTPPGLAETKFAIIVSQEGTPTTGLLNQTDTLNRVLTQSSNAPIAIKANALRFWGEATQHPHFGAPATTPPLTTPSANFFRVGTTCSTPQVTKLTVNPYTGVNPLTGQTPATSNPTTAESAPYTLTGCEKLPFNPTFSAGISGETEVNGHPNLNIRITSPEGDEDLGATRITLPQGIATDLSRIQNACPKATFDADACTDATIIGTVKATLSGIDADVVSGVVHMVKIEGKTLPALGFDFNGRLPLRLSGVSEIDPSGRIVNTFADLPSIPQRSLDVNLYGGAKGILQNSSAKCENSDFKGVLTGQNGKTSVTSIARPCKESFGAVLKNPDSRRPHMTLNGTGATGKKLESVRMTLPPGLTFNRNVSITGYKVSAIEPAVTRKVTTNRLNKKDARFSIPKPGSNGISILSRTGTLAASSAFTKREDAIAVTLRLVYTDGTKINVKAPLVRR